MSASAFATAGIDDTRQRYGRVAQVLHLIIALLIIGQIGLGWYMKTLEGPQGKVLESYHISIGFTVLLLTVARIAWALTHRRPALPAGMPGWEVNLAHFVHALFYVLLLALPLTGWFMESIGARPLHFWGAVFPHFPAMPGLLEGQDKRAIKKTMEWVHGTPLVWTMVALIGLHLAGAIKHQFDGHPILWRMIPGVKRP
jgi:cytochrome b561